jgi:hypothetical protein
MRERNQGNDRQQQAVNRPKRPNEPMLIEVLVREPQRDAPIYTWDAERASLRLSGLYSARPGLPADLATVHLEGLMDLPVLLLHSTNIAPGTLAQARLLGALSLRQAIPMEDASPAEGWVFIAAVQADASLAEYPSLAALPPTQLAVFHAYLQEQARDKPGSQSVEVHERDAEGAARLIRETRLFLKREQRARPRGKAWLGRDEEEKPVAWRAVQGLSEVLRLELQRNALLAQGEDAPHAQAEQLIRFVPQRFQHALAKLLLDDERLLAFVERPLLRHRTGLLGMQTWRSNEGLFLLTDRQALWLRDFLAPGSTFAEGGYIARMVPLERLQSIVVLPPGRTPGEFADRLEANDSPYQRLMLQIASAAGEEFIAIEFPVNAEVEKALAQIAAMLRAFLPQADGSADLRVRRLPVVELWLPPGAEAEHLAGLGGLVSAPIVQRLERQLDICLSASGEELLVKAQVPTLEDFKSPARIVALTRTALLVIDDGGKGQSPHAHRYDLALVSSAQLRYSLLGSGLSVFVPQPDGRTQQLSFPFNSPAVAWFLPLFTRLRLLLSGPYRLK